MKNLFKSLVICGVGCINLTGCLLAAGAAGAEVGYVASQDERTVGQTIDDQAILTSIKTKLLADPDVSGMAINVDVLKTRVTLRGYVKTQKEINKAIALAKSTEGVTSVESRLVLD